MDGLYRFFITFGDSFELVFAVGTVVTVVLSLTKLWFLGFTAPVLSLITTFFWWTSPLPTWRYDTPYMSGLRIIFWLPVTIWFFIVFAVCRLVVHRWFVKRRREMVNKERKERLIERVKSSK